MDSEVIIAICSLLLTFLTFISQIVQSILDYRRDQHVGHTHLYEMRTYQSNCCTNVE